MATIPCPDCGRLVSEYAHACPNCGYPLDEPEPYTTIEFTSKRLKGQMVAAWMMFGIGVIIGFNHLGVGVAVVVLSLFWMWIVKMLIWWHHA